MATAIGRPRVLPDYTCPGCGKTFRPATARQKYCDGECYHHSQRGMKRGPMVPREAKTCPTCSGTFIVGGADNRSRKRVFCSAKCANKQLAPAPRHMSETEIAWLAGLFDGEGSIVSPRGTGVRYSLRITVTNTCRPLLDRTLEVVGTGNIITQTQRNPAHKPQWYWACYGDNARQVLRQMLPWLIVKRERALEALGEETAE